MAPNFRISTFINLKPLHNNLFLIFIFIFFLFVYEMTFFNTLRPQHLLLNTTLPKTSTHLPLNITKPPLDHRQLIRSQTHVSTKLATYLLSNKFPNSNVVFSPMSIHIILSLLATGSNGQTHDKILSFLKMNNTSDLNSLYLELMPFIFADGGPKGGARVSYANGVWVDKTLTLKPSFKHVVETVYKAGCKQVHFQTNAVEIANEVNLWVEKQTDGLITQVLSAEAIHLYPTRLILANAVYFKGAWSQKFNRTATKESSFYLLNGSEVRVPFMTSKEKQLVYEYDEFKVLGLPYLQRQDKRWLTMYFFLPHAKDGLQSLVEKIGSTSNFFESHIPHETREVGEFLIPKFKISFGFEASNMLKELGVLFPSNDVYDFSEMVDLSVGSDWVNVSSLHHKSFVEVNEEGTKASVVSLASFWFSGPGDDAKVDFVGDHPFLFVIREDITGILLFMGQVTNPSVISNNS